MKKIYLYIFICLIIAGLYLFNAYKSEVKKFNVQKNIQQEEIDSLTNQIFMLDEKLKECEKNIQKEQDKQDKQENQEFKHIIDKELSKCIESSNALDYPNCAYEAGEKWKQEINKNLNSLKKVMSETDYRLIEEGQQLWNKSAQKDSEIIKKFISSKGGKINETIGTDNISNLYKERALFLKHIHYYYYEEDKEILKLTSSK